MSAYIIDSSFLSEYERNIEELIGFELEYDDATNPTPLLREIVQCRDCVHYKPYRTHQHGMMNRCHDEHGHTHKRDESDFCSRGERRTDDN